MIHIKTPEEIEKMRESNRLVGEAIATAAAAIKPGITTLQLDRIIEDFIRAHGGIPSFLHYHGFPFSACISVNNAVVHGFPGKHELKDGDILSVDVGVVKDGYHGDSAYTLAVGEISPELQQLLRVTKESLYLGIEQAVAHNRVGDIAFAIQQHTEKRHGYGVVRELVGHGIGRELHEEPQVPNYGKRGYGPKLKQGMAIAIEPMINLGKKEVFTDKDGWTILTRDGKPSAHFEHSVCVMPGRADILSSFDKIEAAEKANPNLFTL